MTQNLLLFALVPIVGVALTVYDATPKHFQTASVEWIAGIAALGVIVRVFRPGFVMTPRLVFGILAIYALYVAIIAVAVGVPLAGVLLLRAPSLLTIVFVEFPVLIWLFVKFSAAPPLYALHSDDATIRSALIESGRRISGSQWWHLFGMQICVGITFGLLAVPGLVVFATFGQTNTMAAAVIAATLYYLGAIPGAAFAMAVTTAIAATSEPRIVPAETTSAG